MSPIIRKKYEVGYHFPGTRLTFVAEAGFRPESNGYNRRRILCKCSCNGNVKEYIAKNVTGKSGNTKSCGCLQREAVIRTGHKNSKLVDGLPSTDHPLYRTWVGIKDRCFRSSHKQYHRYGGRGITMRSEWVDDFPAFVTWVNENLGPRPDGSSLDRWPDCNGDYDIDNLRWATFREQNQNRENSSPYGNLSIVTERGRSYLKFGVSGCRRDTEDEVLGLLEKFSIEFGDVMNQMVEWMDSQT